MLSKPNGLGPQYGAQFGDASVAAAYERRPPYVAEVFDVLVGLIRDEPRAVLDLGTGTGRLARPLASRVDRVDALDLSAAMLAVGRTLPGGAASNLRWIEGPAEDAVLDPPYALITAGASLHWMDWPVVLGRCARMLTANGVLALTGEGWERHPWDFVPLAQKYSTNRDYQPYNLVEELVQRGLFAPLGSHTTAAVAWQQPVPEYVESFHARNGLSRDRMSAAAAAGFDLELTELVRPYAVDGLLPMRLRSTITWGRPISVER